MKRTPQPLTLQDILTREMSFEMLETLPRIAKPEAATKLLELADVKNDDFWFLHRDPSGLDYYIQKEPDRSGRQNNPWPEGEVAKLTPLEAVVCCLELNDAPELRQDALRQLLASTSLK